LRVTAIRGVRNYTVAHARTWSRWARQTAATPAATFHCLAPSGVFFSFPRRPPGFVHFFFRPRDLGFISMIQPQLIAQRRHPAFFERQDCSPVAGDTSTITSPFSFPFSLARLIFLPSDIFSSRCHPSFGLSARFATLTPLKGSPRQSPFFSSSSLLSLSSQFAFAAFVNVYRKVERP